MKAIKFYALIVTLVFMSSCVENSSKYKAIVHQRDSLAMEKMAVDSNYNQTLAIVNDVENGFSQITNTSSEMRVNLKGTEGKSASKKEMIAAQMTVIKENIEKNKAKIAELRRLASKKGKENGKLLETIKRLQTEMDEKGVQIQALQTELDQKNIKITELNTTVTVQSKNIADQQNVMEQQKTTIKGQDTDINTVWYCVATSKKLKAAKIITNTGLFQSRKVMAVDFDNSVFTQVDLRNATSIPTGSKNIKIISSHPLSSYNLVPGDDKNITIQITNPTKFWSVSKYLVVQI